MGNRKQPFGYRMELGEVVIYPQEAEVVKLIFGQYINGASFGELVTALRSQPIPYDGPKPWNKNMVARILEDKRYAGDKGFPAVLEQDTVDAAAQWRTVRRCAYHQTEAQKAIRQLSGQRVTPQIERQVLDLLNGLMGRPERIAAPASDSAAHTALRRELDELLAQLPVDEERARVLALQTAAARYQAIGPGEYETYRLRRVFAEAAPMQELNAELLRAAIAAILIDSSGRVSLRLKNQQIIERRDRT